MMSEQMAVLVDGLFFDEARQIWGEDAPDEPFPQSPRQGAERLEAHFEAGVTGFLLHGGDDLLSLVLSSYFGRPELGRYPLEIAPLDVAGSQVGRHQIERRLTPQKAIRELPRIKTWRRTQLPTLRVVSSLESGPWYGCSFASGWVCNALQAREKARGGAGNLVNAAGELALDTFRADTPTRSERFSVDYSPREPAGRSLVVTSLKKTYFGIRGTADTPLVFSDLDPKELLRASLTPSFLETSAQGESFEVLHLDGPGGWMLDGRFFDSPEPSVLEITPGPSVVMLEAPGGLTSRFGL